MMKLAEAVSNRFPQSSEWARQALAALAGDFDPSTPVHDVSIGWTRRSSDNRGEHVETLFILAGDRLGFGQTGADSREPRWIPLGAIDNVDAVGSSSSALQTIELTLSEGNGAPVTTMLVGWTPEFTAKAVEVLVALAAGNDAGAPAPSAMPAPSAPPEAPVGAETMPAEIATQASMTADTAQLETIAPSNWVEQPVVDARPVAPTSSVAEVPDVPDATIAGPPAFAPEPIPESVPTPAPVVASPMAPSNPSAWFSIAPEVDAAPYTPDAFVAPSEEPASAPAFSTGQDAPTWSASSLGDAPLPAPTPSADPTATVGVPAAPTESAEEYVFDPTVPFDAPEAHEFAAPSSVPAPGSDGGQPTAESPGPDLGPAPWTQPGLVWPEPQRGVLYLGGHPAHPRKRKNGTLVFSPAGIDVSGTGFQSWAMSMDWAYVNNIEIQGPDELMFADNMKIDASSTAMIVQMVDGTRMFFEIRGRRPPSVRSALAPVLLLASGIPAYRAGN